MPAQAGPVWVFLNEMMSSVMKTIVSHSIEIISLLSLSDTQRPQAAAPFKLVQTQHPVYDSC